MGRPHGRDGSASRRRPVVLAVAVVAAVAVVVVAALVVRRDGGGDPQVAVGDDRPGSTTPSTMSVAQLTADQAFARAAETLLTAGSFGYHGTSSATDVSPIRPGPWLAVELTVVGDVDLASNRVREFLLPIGAEETAETVTDGVTVWARRSPDAEALPTLPFEPVRQIGDAGPLATGGALLPSWLAATVDRQDAAAPGGAGEPGQRTFRGTLPASVLGEIETGRAAVDAEVLLTLDAGGAPAHVEVTTAPEGPPLHLAFDLSKFGEPITIDLPDQAA